MRLPRWTVWPALAILFAFAIPGTPWKRVEPKAHPRSVVLGIDGLDPDLLGQFVREHPERYPNFAWLIGQGGLNRLQTSTPPQSPVAWSNFITGLDPGGHGIFDFIHRDPQTREVATSVTKPVVPHNLGLGSTYQLPLGGDPESNRTGKAFWQILAENGVPADVWRVPANFPVTPSKGWSFSGMMTPAIDSAYGEYHLFTTVASVNAVAGSGKIEFVQRYGDHLTLQLPGPPNPFKKSEERVTIALEASIDAQAGAAVLEVGETPLVLKPGQWSDFVRVSFPLLKGASSVAGVVRFYLRSLEPFELYASPVNIDPLDPVTPVSLPKEASAKVAKEIGIYYTQGMPEDVNALKDQSLSDAEFMQQSNLVHGEGERMLDYALARWNANREGGFLFFYFSGVDLCSHMMWRHGDAAHPFHDEALAASPDEAWTHRPGSTWREVLEDIYQRMDPVLGRIRAQLPKDALLIVMSDHGFESWERKFNLNTWLLDNGYLVLKPGEARDLAHADWSKTRAYGVGFNALYLNLAGREGKGGEAPGIVHTGAEADALLAELKAKLESARDPKSPDARPILRVDLAREVYHGERLGEAPDLVVGYNAGYGNSDASTLGRIPDQPFEDNLGGTFNGNHLMAPEVVEGTLLTNGKVLEGRHGLEDLTVEILKQYGIQPGKGMRGHPVLR